MSQRENSCVSTKNFQSRQNSTFWSLDFNLPWRILLKLWTLAFHSHSWKTQSQRKLAISRLKCLDWREKKWDLPSKGKMWSCIFTLPVVHIFGTDVGNEFGVMLTKKGPRKLEFAYDIVYIHSLMIYTDLIEYKVVGTWKPHCCVVFFSFQWWKLETL